jgi:hypothetical protein
MRGWDSRQNTEHHASLKCRPRARPRYVALVTNKHAEIDHYIQKYEDFLPYKVFLYRGWFSSKSAEDDGQRYVYISIEGFFMHVKDLYDRMRAGNKAFFQADYEAWQKGKGMFPYRTWNIHGKPDDGYRKSLFDKFTARQPDLNSKIGSKGYDKEKMEDGLIRIRLYFFTKLAGKPFYPTLLWSCLHSLTLKRLVALLRKSQLSAFSEREFYGRYWDFSIAAAKEESRKAIEGGFFISFAACVKEKAKGKLQGQPSDDASIRTYLLNNMVKPVIEKPTIQFKPALTEKNIVFHSEEKMRFMGGSLPQKLQNHPAGLYRILITGQAEKVLEDANPPLRLPQYGLHESDSEASKMNDFMDKAKEEKFTATETHIEYHRIIRHREQRNQNTCMSNKGTPAKEVRLDCLTHRCLLQAPVTDHF